LFGHRCRGWSRLKTDPKGALADFRKAAEINPRSLIALQNQAHVLADGLKDLDAALVVVTKAAELYPEFAPAIAGRAIVLARLGHRDQAIKEIERAQLLSDDSHITYQAACVYAITSAKNDDDRPKAIALLRQALRAGYSDMRNLATDADLNALRSSRDFLDIQQAAASLYR
jgi:tetratricopeptide (TPR) repeat protein